MINTIETIEDVRLFAEQLLQEGVNFHPDEDFRNYINRSTKLPTYTNEEAIMRNSLMEKCFEVCEHEGEDIYEIMGDVLFANIGIEKE
ncbi:MAG: hypothetical protein F9K23_14455 [Bacteroidetes bacterium]|nr:MAG: hypothetical protein F9K23_14455 [Bacteroidota bacterium]